MFLTWVLLAVVLWGIGIFLVRWENFKQLWLAGVIAMVTVTMVDSVLADGGLYIFHYKGLEILQMPIFYIIALFAGGVFIIHFYPWGNILKGAAFFIFSSLLFLVFEYITTVVGMFEHVKWNFVYSFFINIIGFLITIYLYMLIQAILGRKKYSL